MKTKAIIKKNTQKNNKKIFLFHFYRQGSNLHHERILLSPVH